MNWKFFLFVTLVSVGLVTSYKTSMCSSSEVSILMEPYKQCLLSQSLEVTRTRDFRICKLIDGIIVQCGQILRKCLTEVELK